MKTESAALFEGICWGYSPYRPCPHSLLSTREQLELIVEGRDWDLRDPAWNSSTSRPPHFLESHCLKAFRKSIWPELVNY